MRNRSLLLCSALLCSALLCSALLCSARLGTTRRHRHGGSFQRLTQTITQQGVIARRQLCVALTTINAPLPWSDILKSGGSIMNSKLNLLFASVVATHSFCFQANGQDASFGGDIYASHCAVCHGETGGGDGIVGELFAQRPANLRLLSKENKGIFPMDRVIAAIYGRASIPGHGQTEMPIWGDYFMTEALKGSALDPADAAMITQGRVLSVVSFLQQLQVE
jgi:hypothetical protein